VFGGHDGCGEWVFLLVPAHSGCSGQSPESCKMVVCVLVYYGSCSLE